MKSNTKRSFAQSGTKVMLAAALIFGMAAAASADMPKKMPRLSPKMAELLGKYAAPEQQNWGGKPVTIYYIDPLRFDEFKTEIDALGKYQTGGRTYTRDWEQGAVFARWCARADGSFQLDLCKADNSVSEYQYKKFPKAQGVKADELRKKYAAPAIGTWENPPDTVIFSIDPLHFDEFKAELDATGEYSQVYNEDWDNRDWDRGKSFALWIIFTDGYELRLMRKDNTVAMYEYKKAK